MAESPLDPLIGAAMLQFPAHDRRGVPMAESHPDEWLRVFRELRAAGFEHFELSSAWIDYPNMSRDRLEILHEAVASAGLRIVGTSVVRRSVLHEERGPQNLEYSHRAIEASRVLDVGILCLGLHDALRPDQREAEWFWTPANPPPAEGSRELAIATIRELAAHGAQTGVDLSLELYEDTFLGAGAAAVTFLEDIGSPNVGLNPDLGNLVRRQGPVESWEEIARATLPHTNYWHVKNIMRAQTASGETVTFPVPLVQGVINYRTLVAYAMERGFAGPLIVEHYGGDGLGVGAINRDYLRGLYRERAAISQAPA